MTAWNNRPLSDSPFPFVLVDALYLKVREEGRVRSRGVMLGIGINTDGHREVLGLMLGDTESEESWTEFFSWLKTRGLRGVDLIVSDDHGGLVRSIRKQLQGVTWQRCQTHFMRNILDASPKDLKEEIHAHVRAILEAPDPQTARMLLNLYFVKQKSPKKSCIFPHHRRGEFLPLFHERMFHSVALTLENEQVPVVSQPVNHRRGHLVIGEDRSPSGEFQIGGND